MLKDLGLTGSELEAIHMDVDESADLSCSSASSILEEQQRHLLPNILHLVIADGACREGW